MNSGLVGSINIASSHESSIAPTTLNNESRFMMGGMMNEESHSRSRSRRNTAFSSTSVPKVKTNFLGNKRMRLMSSYGVQATD